MDQQQIISQLAERLWAAETGLAPIETISARHPALTTAEAYQVQAGVAGIRRTLGHRPCGHKIGLTSRAVQEMVGLNEPDYGHLFDEMRIEDGGIARLQALIQPKIEPELAFVFARPLSGPDVTVGEVLAAVDHVAAAFEIVDCRIRDWQVRGIDAVCDNGSASRFVLGRDRIPAGGTDLGAISATFERNGEIVATPSMSEVMGNPANAVCWLVTKLSTQGQGIEAGDVVLTGAPCRPSDVAVGDVFRATFTGLGSVTVSWA